MEGEVPIAEVISGLALGLQDWGSNVLRDLEKRLKKAKKELEGCRRMVISQQTVTKEAVLRFKVDRLEEQIDIFWKQRAHVNWLTKGDGNTTFFHQCCKERRRQNRIGNLKKADGGWAEEEVEKQDII